MALNGSQELIAENRRRIVAAGRLRGLTIRGIAEALAREGIVNPRTERPWSVAIIHKDIQTVEAEWRAESQQDIAEHKARCLARIEEAYRQAWKSKDAQGNVKVDWVLKALEDMRKLMGLDAPARAEYSGPGSGALNIMLSWDDARLNSDESDNQVS